MTQVVGVIYANGSRLRFTSHAFFVPNASKCRLSLTTKGTAFSNNAKLLQALTSLGGYCPQRREKIVYEKKAYSLTYSRIGLHLFDIFHFAPLTREHVICQGTICVPAMHHQIVW
jgi:hypothetical protein